MIFVVQKRCMSQESVRIMTETSDLDIFWTFHGCAPYPGQWLPYPDQWREYPDHWPPYPGHWPPYPGQGFLWFFNDLYCHHFLGLILEFSHHQCFPTANCWSHVTCAALWRLNCTTIHWNINIYGQQRHSHVHQIWCRAGSTWFLLITDVQQRTIYPESLRWHFTLRYFEHMPQTSSAKVNTGVESLDVC